MLNETSVVSLREGATCGNCTYLPQFHLYSGVELHKTCLEVHGLGLGVLQVDGPVLVLVLVDMAKMGAQLEAERT